MIKPLTEEDSVKICSLGWCDDKVLARGLCKRHYSSFFKSGGRDESKYPKIHKGNIFTIKDDHVTFTMKKNKVCIFDLSDLDLVKKYTWHIGKGYACTGTPDGRIDMHRLIMDFPKEVDHINGNRLDNRRKNLRRVTHQQNCWNVKKTRGTSKYLGVSWVKERRKWRAHIRIAPKNLFLGYYTNEEDAAMVRDRWVMEHRGEYGVLNFK